MPANETQKSRRLIVDDSQAIHDDFDTVLSVTGGKTDFAPCETAFFGTSQHRRPAARSFDVDHTTNGRDVPAMVQAAGTGRESGVCNTQD